MFQVESVEQWKGQDVLDESGEKVGKLDDVLFDTSTGEPSLAVVKVGRLSKSHVLVPLAGASLARDHVRLIHAKDLVESAPRLGSDGVSRADETTLALHYGITAPVRDEQATGDSQLYESSTDVEEREAAAKAARAQASDLEAEAERKQKVVVEGQTTAALADDRAQTADEERRRLLAEADDLRRQAGDAGS